MFSTAFPFSPFAPAEWGRNTGLSADDALLERWQCGSISYMARFVSSYLFLLMVIGSFSVPALAKETADSPGELKRLELLAQTGASTGTNQVLRLRGADARQQLLVTASFSTGALRDYTREVRYETSPTGVIQVSKTGRVTPLAEGTSTITAKSSTDVTATLRSEEHTSELQSH